MEERSLGGPLIGDLLCLGAPKDPVLPAKMRKDGNISALKVVAYFNLEGLVSKVVARFFVINKDVVMDAVGVIERLTKSRSIQVGIRKVRVTPSTDGVNIREVGDI